MTSEEAFAIWAPDGVLWSEWAKPVAFIQAGGVIDAEPIAESDLPALPVALDSSAGVIVDLPGASAVHAGLALAARGFRPVPLFNGTSGPMAVIDVSAIRSALGGGAERLKRAGLARDARPAFLLDSRRRGTSQPGPGAYDNRWVTLPQDFPSGALLANRGIKRTALIQSGSLSIAADLAHVLRRWQESGIEVSVYDLATGQIADAVAVPKPSGFKLAWYAAIAVLGLRRSNVGGFGSPVPEQTSRSGFYG